MGAPKPSVCGYGIEQTRRVDGNRSEKERGKNQLRRHASNVLFGFEGAHALNHVPHRTQ